MDLVANRLETALQEAERELQQLDDRVQARPEVGLGQGNVGGYSWEMALARRRTVRARIKDLQEALNRVQQGTYGQCRHCGVRIEPERLEILPATVLCSACARERGTRSRSLAPGAMDRRATHGCR